MELHPTSESDYQRKQITFAASLQGRLNNLAIKRKRSDDKTIDDAIIILATLKMPAELLTEDNEFTIYDPGFPNARLTLNRAHILSCVEFEKGFLMNDPEEWITGWNNVSKTHLWFADKMGYEDISEMYTDAMLAGCNALEPLYQK